MMECAIALIGEISAGHHDRLFAGVDAMQYTHSGCDPQGPTATAATDIRAHRAIWKRVRRKYREILFEALCCLFIAREPVLVVGGLL